MTTNEAFEHLTSQREWYKLCSINGDTARSLKRHYHDGKISTDKIYQLLQSAGYVSVVNWKPPKKQKIKIK